MNLNKTLGITIILYGIKILPQMVAKIYLQMAQIISLLTYQLLRKKKEFIKISRYICFITYISTVKHVDIILGFFLSF